MSAADLPMMPFFVKDWMTATLHWPAAERGAYISLLAFQWVNRVLPADEGQLARITGLAQTEFVNVWQTLGSKFESDEHGLFNERLEEIRAEALKLRDARAHGASLANQKRLAKRTALRDAANDADFHAEHGATRTHTSTDTSTDTFQEKKNTSTRIARRSARAQRVSRETVALVHDAADEDWIRIKLTVPRRAGSQPWERGRKAWLARRAEGYSVATLHAGCERWARYVTQTAQDPRYVMQVATFFGPEKHFLADWEIPAPANDTRWSPTGDEAEDPPDGYAA